MVKNLPAVLETCVQSLGQEDRPEKEMATHSSILARKNPMDRGAWWATVHGVARVRHELATKPLLEHSHSHSFMYCLWQLSCYNSSCVIAVIQFTKPKMFTFWTYTEKRLQTTALDSL